MINITSDTLKEIAGSPGNQRVRDGLAKYLPDVMEQFQIDTPLRAAHFLAQLGHESDHFRTLQEYASGKEYEGRKDLGNIYRGDGPRFKGRGPIQITGRFNYRKYGQLLGIPLEANPEQAALPDVGTKIAGEYWNLNHLNALADADDLIHITKKINGGLNGIDSRRAMLDRAKKVLSV